jgi:hypothetical protein
VERIIDAPIFAEPCVRSAKNTLFLFFDQKAALGCVFGTRRLYDAGMELDPANPPVADETTLYDHYRIVPIRFSHLNQ